MTKKDASIFIGNLLNHFDTALYGFLVPILAPVFFADSEPVIRLIYTYSVLAISILVRPIGVIIFGSIAKTGGAALALSYSLTGMAASTMVIGFLPGYAFAGYLSPILLILTKIFGEIFAAGEVSISKLYVLEDKKADKAFRVSYFYPVSSMGGIILASIVSNIIISCDSDGLWRFGFIIGGVTGVIGYILRKYAVIDDVKPKTESVALALPNLWRHRAVIFKSAMVSGFSYLTYVIPFVLMNGFLPFITNITFHEMMKLNSFLLIFDMVMILLIGKLVTPFKPRLLMKVASFILLITIIPLWWGLQSFGFYYVSFVRLWIIVWGVIFLLPLNLWLYNLVKSSDKYTLIGIGTTLGDAIIGRTAPALCLFLWYATDNILSIAAYIAFLALLTSIVLRYE